MSFNNIDFFALQQHRIFLQLNNNDLSVHLYNIDVSMHLYNIDVSMYLYNIECVDTYAQKMIIWVCTNNLV